VNSDPHQNATDVVDKHLNTEHWNTESICDYSCGCFIHDPQAGEERKTNDPTLIR
jgi:hypothetical protein